MSSGNRMLLAEAERLGQWLVGLMSPACERIEIAGSVRRGMRLVSDIELLAIPRHEGVPPEQGSLFGDASSPAYLPLHDVITASPLWPVRPGSNPPEPDYAWHTKRPAGASKYWRLGCPLYAGSCLVDLFLCTPQTWGVLCVIRTGPAEFSRWFVTEWARRTKGGRVHQGRMHPPSRVHPPPVYGPASAPLDEPLSTPEERDAFRALGIPWIPPTDREDWRLRVGA